MTTTYADPVLVTGSTGRTGARLARRLSSRHVPVHGVRSAYLCYSPDLAFPGVPELMADFAGAAADAGVRQLVLLSGRGEDGARAAEDALRASGLEWTVLRCAWFAQNFSEHFLLGPVRRGRLLLPADGGIAKPFLDLDDLAEVAAESLTTDRHLGQVLELTGPRLLTLREVAAELSAAMGRPVEFVPCSAQEFAADLAADGIPAEEAEPLAGLFTEILDGRNATLTPDLARALGRQPRDFGTYAAHAAAAGVWAAPAGRELL